MHAAVVHSFDHPPGTRPVDTPNLPDPMRCSSRAGGGAATSGPATGAASGRHYTSTGELPMIPGIDGDGRLPDGRRIYFASPDDAWGSMAERAVVELRRIVSPWRTLTSSRSRRP